MSHVDRGELPHEGGLRKAREEMGIKATLVADTPSLSGADKNQLPQPRHNLLYDINTYDGTPGHQHVDIVYYATVPHRDVDPEQRVAPPNA